MRPALIFFAIFAFSDGARILGLFPHTGKSHQMVFEPLLRTLAKRGHHVTVASFFPLKDPPANYTEISFRGIANIGLETIDLNNFENPSLIFRIPGVQKLLSPLIQFQILADVALKVCEKAVDWPPLTAALQKNYDLVIVESFNSDCMVGLLDVYNVRAPKIALLSCIPMPWTAPRFGLNDNPSHVPLITYPHTTQMTFTERLSNTLANVIYRNWYKYEILAKEQAIIEKHFERKISHLDELAKNISLVLINTFHTLNGVKPLLPAIAEVGGMHLDPTRKPIPQVSNNYQTENKEKIIKYCDKFK